MRFLISIISILVSLNIYAANLQVHYEPSVVELTGRLKRETFPGAPNYESIKMAMRLKHITIYLWIKKLM